MFNFIKDFIMTKKLDIRKEEYRGTLKQIMKVRGLRTISIANFNAWLKENDLDVFPTDIHSIKIDIQDGYINAYGFKDNSERCGYIIPDATADNYAKAYDAVMAILSNENMIPSKVKKNILVKLSR